MKSYKHFIKTAKRITSLVMAATAFAFLAPVGSYASQPFESYSINYWEEPVAQPYPYLYKETIFCSGQNFSFPQDMFFYEGMLYVADTGNNRIVKMDTAGNVSMIIDRAEDKENDTLLKPEGVFVNTDGHIYVADSGNKRIIEYTNEGKYVRKIERPVTDLIADNTEFKPTKVVVDKAGRIYCVAYGINMGLVEFDKEGNFQGFMGATEVTVGKFAYIWKNYFATDEQKLRMKTIIPTEYSNIFVDKENFIYATINNLTEEEHAKGADAVRRLNPTGTDVLRRLANYPIVGDIHWSDGEYASFTDVASTDYGCYFILDNNMGKVYTYDYDGNSLFVFGRKGVREGNVMNPSALVISDDAGSVYILDSNLGSIIRFDITEYGRNVLDALYLNDKGDSEGSNACWQEVLKKNANSELAYIGLGKTYLSSGDYKTAMKYFKLGNSRKYYSKAFYYRRREVMEKNFAKGMLAVGIILVVVLAIVLTKKIKKWRVKVKCFMENR